MLRKKIPNKFGQVLIEFTFSMIIVFLMIYAFTKIFDWSGREITNRRIMHDNVLKSTSAGTQRGYNTVNDSEQIQQISPFFSSGTPMNAVWPN